jgi:HEAT repeat protein
VCSLVVCPKQAVELLSKRLTPSRVDVKQVRRWLEQLDDESFEVREAGDRALAALGDHVEEDLRRDLIENPPLEPRTRLERLLRRLERGTPDGLRRVRGIEVLERIGSPEAVAVLKRLAAGHAGARQTREASAALARLKARP